MPTLLADANRGLIPLPTLWLFGIGAALAAVAVVAAWGLLRLVSPRLAAEARASLQDGFLGPVSWVVLVSAALAVAFLPLIGLPLPPDFTFDEASPLAQIGRSLVRLTAAGEVSRSFPIEAGAQREEIRLPLRPQELATLRIEAQGPLIVRVQQPVEGFAIAKTPDIRLVAAEPWTWQRKEGATNPFLGSSARLEVSNEGTGPVRLDVRWELVPEQPLAAVLPWTFVALVALAAAYACFRLGAGRVAAIASATTKEAIGQPLFAVVIVTGILLLVGFTVIPYNTFGDDVKMYKDSGVTLIKVLALLAVSWTAGVAVSDEIEGRTAVTVLSKPLTRWQFVLGKFAGLVLVALLVCLILGAVLLAVTPFKVVYDAREAAETDPLWWECLGETVSIVPALALAFMETVVLAAIALAASTRLGPLPNLVICFTVYALGHLVPLIVRSSVGRDPIVRFTGQLFATILPVLDHFTVEAALVGDVPIPWDYLAWAGLYAALYSGIMLVLALLLFRSRDLA